MKFTGTQIVSASREKVYNALLDPEVLSRTIPGCEEMSPIGEDEYEMKMKFAMASVSGLFDSKVKLEDKNPPESYRLSVEGRGKIGFVNGSGVFRLEESGEAETTVNYEGDVKVGGMIAGVGQRLMDMTSKMMIKRFFAALSEEIKS
jgi:carbon monoxide dehydrogenase subunit G